MQELDKLFAEKCTILFSVWLKPFVFIARKSYETKILRILRRRYKVPHGTPVLDWSAD